MFKNIFSWGSSSPKKSKLNTDDEIKPIVVDPAILNPEFDDTDERKQDELEIEKLETYYYKDTSEKKLNLLLFEKMP